MRRAHVDACLCLPQQCIAVVKVDERVPCVASVIVRAVGVEGKEMMCGIGVGKGVASRGVGATVEGTT